MPEKSPFWSKVAKLSNEFFPICGAIEVTNRCNARCQYCYIPDRISSPELTTSQIHYIIDKLNKSGIIFLNITGGEPFLRKDISEILEHCFTCDFFNISIYSNGTVISDSHFKQLEKYHDKINPFRMTVFSHIDEIHDTYMDIPGSLKLIIKNARTFLDLGIDVQLAIPVMSFNVDTFQESISYFAKQGIPIGINTVKLITESNDSSLMRHMISEDFYHEFLLKYTDANLSSAIQSNEMEESTSDKLCRGIREMIMIDTHGNIHPCTTFRKFTIGSILQDVPLNEILKSNKEYIWLKNLTKNDLVCSQCENSHMCSPCLAQKHTMTGSFDGPYTQNCNYTNALLSAYKERCTK